MGGQRPDLSIVIPMRNEAENAAALLAEIAACGASLPRYEVIAVDDGSSDATAEVVGRIAAGDRRVRLLRHPQAGGQSAAVHSGVMAARAALVATLDGDGQNPPAELPRLVAPLLAPGSDGIGLVAGQRVGRRDSLSKRAASVFANGLRARLLRDGTRDTGCGLKAFRREAFLGLPYFDHMHRYLPALFRRDGWEVVLVDVTHRARLGGRSNYNNLHRALVGIHDLIGVSWLIRRRKKARPVEVPQTEGS